jgi:hypothetical protein
MNGMQMMLKSFGIEPEKMIKEVLESPDVKRFFEQVASMSTRMETFEAKQDVIIQQLRRIEIKLGTIPTEEAMKLLADNVPSAEELEKIIYGRNNSNTSDGATD